MDSLLRQIRVEAVELPRGVRGQGRIPEAKTAEINWLIDSGDPALVTGGRSRLRSLLLRLMAGLESPVHGRIEFSLQNGRHYPSVESGKIRAGYLPPPGEESFVGTTVEQELGYGLPDNKAETRRIASLEELFGVRFCSADRRSVWALSDGERRLLILASQALTRPDVLFCDEPLALLDGEHSEAVCNFLAGETRRGAAVVVSAAEAGRLKNWVRTILVFSNRGGVLFQGKADNLPEEVAHKLDWYHPLAHKLAAAGLEEGGKSFTELLARERSDSLDH